MVKPDGPFYKIRLFGLRGRSLENPPGKSLSHQMKGFSLEEGISKQSNCQAMQEGFSNHLKDRHQSNRMRLNKPLNGQSSHGKQKLRSAEIGNRMPGTSEQQNAGNLKEMVLESPEDDVISNKRHLSVKLHQSKDRNTK